MRNNIGYYLNAYVNTALPEDVQKQISATVKEASEYSVANSIPGTPENFLKWTLFRLDEGI
jgi:hypothetical protein